MNKRRPKKKNKNNNRHAYGYLQTGMLQFTIRNQNKNFEGHLQDYLPFIEIGNQIPPLFCFSFDNLPDIIATFQLQRRYVINDRCLTLSNGQ